LKTEEKIKKYLIKWLKQRGKEAIEEITMPPMKYEDKANRPDVFAYRKRANTVYLIECKKATRLRYIGHAFGQIMATKLSFEKMKRKNLLEKLKKVTNKNKVDNLKFEFGVAFLKKQVNASRSVEKMISMFHNLDAFNDFTVYLVDRNLVERRYRGRPVTFSRLHKK